MGRCVYVCDWITLDYEQLGINTYLQPPKKKAFSPRIYDQNCVLFWRIELILKMCKVWLTSFQLQLLKRGECKNIFNILKFDGRIRAGLENFWTKWMNGDRNYSLLMRIISQI